MGKHRLDRLVDQPQDFKVRGRVHVHLQSADTRPGGAEAGRWREPTTVGWRRAGEAATGVVCLWGFRTKGIGGGSARGSAGTDDGGGERAGDSKPEATTEVAPIEEGDG